MKENLFNMHIIVDRTALNILASRKFLVVTATVIKQFGDSYLGRTVES